MNICVYVGVHPAVHRRGVYKPMTACPGGFAMKQAVQYKASASGNGPEP